MGEPQITLIGKIAMSYKRGTVSALPHAAGTGAWTQARWGRPGVRAGEKALEQREGQTRLRTKERRKDKERGSPE